MQAQERGLTLGAGVDQSVDVSVVVVVHNHEAYITRCLTSLRSLTGVSVEIIVVDNRSDDSSAEVVQRSFPEVTLIVNRRRRRLASNNNRAIRRGHGRHVLILNPDTEVMPGTVEGMVAFMDEHPDVGVCGPKLLFPDGRLQLSCRRFPTVRSTLLRRSPLRKLILNSIDDVSNRLNQEYLMADWDHNSIRAVDWMLGACYMLRRSALDDVGYFDEGYWLYSEDVDMCYRMAKHGWSVFYLPHHQVIHHHQGMADRSFLSRYNIMDYQGMIRFCLKHKMPWRG